MKKVFYRLTGLVMIVILIYIINPFKSSYPYVEVLFSEYYNYPLFRVILFLYISCALFMIILPKFKDDDSKLNKFKWLLFIVCILISVLILTDLLLRIIFYNFEIRFV